MELELSQACVQAALNWHRDATEGDSQGKAQIVKIHETPG